KTLKSHWLGNEWVFVMVNTKTILVLSVIALACAVTCLPARAQNTCSGVDRTLSKERAEAFEPSVARQLRAKQVDIMQSFRFRGWSILYVDPHQSEEVFVFYSSNPMRTNYVTLWSGAAREDEQDQIRAWTIKNAPGIPHALANCFAWHVTRDRDK
ncbi:MAG TPA: hypothetical protein VHE33_15450, partial [Acidobacteriaceae bacterium]|nr:hypothetical protein [Acidobacteriaceae bacterium]